MKHHKLAQLFGSALLLAASAMWLGGCVVAARPGYATYGYSNYAAPQTVYYNGGYYGGSYYRPGYYHRTAPFVAVQSAPVVYSQPAYAQPVYTQPGYAQPVYTQPGYAQPVYRPQGGVAVGVAAPGVSAGVRVGVPVP